MMYGTVIKWAAIVAGIVLLFWAAHTFMERGEEIDRMQANFKQQAMIDSLKIANYVLSQREIRQTIEGNPDLAKLVQENSIKTSRIESILMQQLLYRDNTVRTTNLQPILDAIQAKQKIAVPWVDSTACLKVRGQMVYTGDTLLVKVTDREFTNNYTAIGYLQRRQWKFLGIKTRLFGKLEGTAVIKNTCGETKTISIEKKKE